MHLRSFILAIAATSLSACHLPSFHTQAKGEMTIPQSPSPLGGVLRDFPVVASFTNIDFNQNQDFKNQGINKDHVSSVQVDSVQLQINSPNDQGFDFLDSLQFFAEAGNQEAEVAEKSSIRMLGLGPPNPVLNMDVTRAELQPYVTAPSMSIVVRGQGTFPRSDTTIAITV